MKLFLNSKEIEEYLKLHKNLKIPYTVALSNYTTRIKSLAYDLHFMKSEQSKRVFAAFAKVKSDCTKKPLPEIERDNLQYYSQQISDTNFYADVIYNFDFKAAYATILFNDGYISIDTLNYVLKLPKQERLTAIGMLAAQKEIFTFNEKNEIILTEEIISKNQNYFFYAIKKTSEIINEAAQILGNSFLFSWVDGIYFIDNPDSVKDTARIMLDEFFDKKNIRVSFDLLTNFEIKHSEDFFTCSYIKEGKTKAITIPKPNNEVKIKIEKYLLKKNY